MQENERLTSKQASLIAALVAGNSMLAACQSIGINESTGHRWRQLPHFKQAFDEARRQAHAEIWRRSMEQLEALMPKAMETLQKHLDAPTRPSAHTQMTGVALAFDKLFESRKMSKLDELEKQIEELKAIVAQRAERRVIDEQS